MVIALAIALPVTLTHKKRNDTIVTVVDPPEALPIPVIPVAGYILLYHQDLEGWDLNQFYLLPSECGKVCDENPNCVGFVTGPYFECWLKSYFAYIGFTQNTTFPNTRTRNTQRHLWTKHTMFQEMVNGPFLLEPNNGNCFYAQTFERNFGPIIGNETAMFVNGNCNGRFLLHNTILKCSSQKQRIMNCTVRLGD